MENKDVNQVSSPEVSEDFNTQNQNQENVVVPPINETPKGSQTPPENLYAALAEERRLRKEAEDKLTNLTTTPQADETYSDEGRVLSDKIRVLEDKIELQELQTKFPELKTLSNEFTEFRREYPRHKGENVAKLFLSEKGILEPIRKGLEQPTGGQRVAPSPEMTVDDVSTLRKTNYRKYTDMVKKGLIKV